MLPQENRLKKKKDFERIFKNGRGLREGFLTIRFGKNGDDLTRIGFVVSKKISKKAVVRNKIKRHLREAARNLLPNVKKGFDVAVFVAYKPEKCDHAEIERIFIAIFKKAGLLTDQN